MMNKLAKQIMNIANKIAIFSYSKLSDAVEVTGNDDYLPGKSKIWYAKHDPQRDLMFGYNYVQKHPDDVYPVVRDLFTDVSRHIGITHVLLGTMQRTDLGTIYEDLQGEKWSPNGEARSLLTRLGLKHTTMSVGDIIQQGNRFYFVDRMGFKQI